MNKDHGKESFDYTVNVKWNKVFVKLKDQFDLKKKNNLVHKIYTMHIHLDSYKNIKQI